MSMFMPFQRFFLESYETSQECGTLERQAKPETFILIVILPNSAGPIRNVVKYWGDVRYGTSTGLFEPTGSETFRGFRCDDSMPSVGEVPGC